MVRYIPFFLMLMVGCTKATVLETTKFDPEDHCDRHQACFVSLYGQPPPEAEMKLCASAMVEAYDKELPKVKALIDAFYTDCSSAEEPCDYAKCIGYHLRAHQLGSRRGEPSVQVDGGGPSPDDK